MSARALAALLVLAAVACDPPKQTVAGQQGAASATAAPSPEAGPMCKALRAAAAEGKAIKDLPGGNPPRQRGEHHSVWDSGHAQSSYECLAIAKDDDAMCANLEESMRARCKMTRAMYHSFRKAPKGAGWRVPDDALGVCQTLLHDAEVCAGFVKALSSGQPSQCPSDPRVEIMCRAMVTGDPAVCPPERDEFEPGKEHRPGPKGCELMAATYRAVGKDGLEGLAKAGLEEHRTAYALAALGKPGACDEPLDALEKLCVLHTTYAGGGQ